MVACMHEVAVDAAECLQRKTSALGNIAAFGLVVVDMYI